MRGLLVAAVVAIVSVCSGAAFAHPPSIVSPDVEKASIEEITAFRRDYVAAIAAKDGKKLEAMISKSFIQTHGTGRQDGRDARIAGILAGDPVIDTLVADDLKIRVYAGGWTAVATAKSNRTLKDGTKQLLAWTAVYVRNDTSWELAASHVTRLSETKP
jgi:ketosteroid isomerase-like protein